jgi:oxygen-dependent protoporphyrinogen oxidase
MWSFREGLRVLIDELGKALRTPPLTGVGARRVRRTNAGWCVEAGAGRSWVADAVVLTCPADRQAELLADEAPDLAASLAAIPYNRVVVVAVGYRRQDVPRPLDGFGYLSPQRARRDVLGVQWCSSIYPERAPEGTVLLRAMCGGWNRPEVVDWPDERLVAAVHAELVDVLRVRAAPIFQHVIRWDRAIPQYHVGHLARLGWIEQRVAALPGLYLGGNAYRGVAINDCIEQAGRLAESVSERMKDEGGRRKDEG